jgi:hypothetical protein
MISAARCQSSSVALENLVPFALRPAHGAAERCKAVLVALAWLGPGFEQDRRYVRATEERGPTKRDRVVLRIQK